MPHLLYVLAALATIGLSAAAGSGHSIAAGRSTTARNTNTGFIIHLL
jgi:hypothetical protein